MSLRTVDELAPDTVKSYRTKLRRALFPKPSDARPEPGTHCDAESRSGWSQQLPGQALVVSPDPVAPVNTNSLNCVEPKTKEINKNDYQAPIQGRPERRPWDRGRLPPLRPRSKEAEQF